MAQIHFQSKPTSGCPNIILYTSSFWSEVGEMGVGEMGVSEQVLILTPSQGRSHFLWFVKYHPNCDNTILLTNWMVICGNNRLLLLNLACGCMWILLCMKCVCGVSNSDPIVQCMLPCMKEFLCEKVFLFAIRQADRVYITKDRLYVANHGISACCYCLTWL